MVEGYCVKCKMKKPMQDVVMTQTARGGFMAKGKCSCGTTMCAMISKENAERAVAEGHARKGY